MNKQPGVSNRTGFSYFLNPKKGGRNRTGFSDIIYYLSLDNVKICERIILTDDIKKVFDLLRKYFKDIDQFLKKRDYDDSDRIHRDIDMLNTVAGSIISYFAFDTEEKYDLVEKRAMLLEFFNYLIKYGQWLEIADIADNSVWKRRKTILQLHELIRNEITQIKIEIRTQQQIELADKTLKSADRTLTATSLAVLLALVAIIIAFLI